MMKLPNTSHHSSLVLFQKPPVLVSFNDSQQVEILPNSSPNSKILDFNLQTDRNVYLDLETIELKVTVKIITPDATDHPMATIAMENNHMWTLFKNCTVQLINEIIHNSQNLFAQRSFIETELSSTKSTGRTFGECQGYYFEENGSTATDKRKGWVENTSKTFSKTFNI